MNLYMQRTCMHIIFNTFLFGSLEELSEKDKRRHESLSQATYIIRQLVYTVENGGGCGGMVAATATTTRFKRKKSSSALVRVIAFIQ